MPLNKEIKLQFFFLSLSIKYLEINQISGLNNP